MLRSKGVQEAFPGPAAAEEYDRTHMAIPSAEQRQRFSLSRRI